MLLSSVALHFMYQHCTALPNAQLSSAALMHAALTQRSTLYCKKQQQLRAISYHCAYLVSSRCLGESLMWQ
jgi:hypothetical protein